MYKRCVVMSFFVLFFLCGCASAPAAVPEASASDMVADSLVPEPEPIASSPEETETAAPVQSESVQKEPQPPLDREGYQDFPPVTSISETGATVIDVLTDCVQTTDKYSDIVKAFEQTSYENAVLLKKVPDHYENEVVTAHSAASENFSYTSVYDNGAESGAGVWVVRYRQGVQPGRRSVLKNFQTPQELFAYITDLIDDPQRHYGREEYAYIDDHTLWVCCPGLLECTMIFSYNGDCLIRISDKTLDTAQAARDLWAQFAFEKK